MAETVRLLVQHIEASVMLPVECVQQEIVDVLLDPYRLEGIAIKICAETKNCLQYLKDEAVRVSRQPAGRFEGLNAVGLWGEISKYAGFNRIRPPRLEDLPLKEDPHVIFDKLKRERLSERELNKDETLRFACAALAALVGPGKAKILTAAKQSARVYKVQQSHQVEKLINNNRLPKAVKDRFKQWATEVEQKGLEEVRRVPGYHDEPIKSLPGRRSVRVGEGFRACYETFIENGIEVLKVITISADHRNSAYCR